MPVPAHFFSGLSAATLRAGDETLYAIYQARFGINIVKATEELRAVTADPVATKVFGVPVGTPLLEVFRLAYTFNNVLVEVRRSKVLTRDYHYRFDHGDV